MYRLLCRFEMLNGQGKFASGSRIYFQNTAEQSVGRCVKSKVSFPGGSN